MADRLHQLAVWACMRLTYRVWVWAVRRVDPAQPPVCSNLPALSVRRPAAPDAWRLWRDHRSQCGPQHACMCVCAHDTDTMTHGTHSCLLPQMTSTQPVADKSRWTHRLSISHTAVP